MSQKTLRSKRFAMDFGTGRSPRCRYAGPELGEAYLALIAHQNKIGALRQRSAGVPEKAKNAGMALITNGFKEVQYKKSLKAAVWMHFLAIISFISEEVGYHKTQSTYFIAALTAINGKKKETLMVGDHFRKRHRRCASVWN